MKNKKVLLAIMDGWGHGQVKSSDAIQNANVPFVSSLYDKYPNTTLTTCGTAVGLPEGQMGNSEVGHLNLGAGRIVYQELERINVAIRNKTFDKNPVLIAAIEYCKTNNKPLHLLGLVSDGGVHSHINHVKAIADVCNNNGMHNLLIHAFTDGRDTDPKSGLHFIKELQDHLAISTGNIATITGRYYAMDRDKRWERVKVAYDAMVNAVGTKSTDLLAAIKTSYENNVTDEFIQPIINANLASTTIKDGDAVICFNFRTDRCREITDALTQTNFPDQNMHTLNLNYTTMTLYDHAFKNIHVIFEKDNLDDTLGEVLAKNNKTQLRMAETEKYPHVTFFFSGGREEAFMNEKRLMAPSPKVATYDLQPEMSAYELTALALEEIDKSEPDFICLNYANADMVGHTGVWEAIVKAVETVDTCVSKLVAKALEHDYCIFLTADHGNADFAINADGTPNTAHTTNPVPLFVIDKEWHGNLRPGKLGDIAPSILTMMHIPIPEKMTGEVIIS